MKCKECGYYDYEKGCVRNDGRCIEDDIEDEKNYLISLEELKDHE